MDKAFFTPDGDLFVSTAMTRGPWDNRFQHGGPPSALLTGMMARFEGGEGFAVARVTLELLRPVPIAPLRAEVTPIKMGRTVQRLQATLSAGDDVVVLARCVRIRRKTMVVPEVPMPAPWADPESLDDFDFPFFAHEVGYHKGVQVKVAEGAWGSTPIKVWTRPRIPLVAGRETSALEALMILADAQSGMGVPLDPMVYSFINPDLTVYLEREPVGPWIGFDIRSTANTEGFGLAQSAVRDAAGWVARSAQGLVVAGR